MINGIYTNKAIININNVDKHSYMSEVLDYILYYFIKMVEKYQKKYSTKTKKYIKNYNFFVFSLLLQIDYQKRYVELLLKQKVEGILEQVLF